MFVRNVKALAVVLVGVCGTLAAEDCRDLPVPSEAQLKYLSVGVMGIIHFGPNTYTDMEWGYGDASPSLFNPKSLDAEQWVLAAKRGGLKRLILVAKHHDGFCLFPSALNADYTVANSPWKGGKGDLVREVSEACRRQGIEFGVYLSPWDRHRSDYATAAYVDYFQNQWDELLENYGLVCENWLDGANGGDGWYGGARETRKLPCKASEYYRFNELLKKMVTKNPLAVSFGGGRTGNCVGWVGNEVGANRETRWMDENGYFLPLEADTPFRRDGWFWHPSDRAKALMELVEIYFRSVGRSAVLNLGFAPNREGLLDEGDVRRLAEFGDWVREYEAKDFAVGAKRNEQRTGLETEIVLEFPEMRSFDAIDFGEDLSMGQQVAEWRLESLEEGGTNRIVAGTTVGYRRMSRFPDVTARGVRLVCRGRTQAPRISRVSLRKRPPVAEDTEPDVFLQWRSPCEVSEPEDGLLVFDFLRSISADSIQYVPPKDRVDRVPDQYEVSVSDDGKTWRVVANGEFGNLRANPVRHRQTLSCGAVRMRYARVRATRALEGTPSWKDTSFFFYTASAENSTADVPFCALRFGYRYTQPDAWPEMRTALEKNRGAFDEIWFSTGVSFPPLSWHEEHARQCAKAADDLRKLGIVPSIEIQTVIGHTDAILDAGDCTGQDWGTMVSADGLAAKRLSCPRDPKLIDYFVRVAELHAAWLPGSVWVDDDLSYRNRAPLLRPENNLPGCFCDRCLSGFAKVEGRVWDRGDLARTIRADESVRRRWDDYSCAGFGELTRAIAAAVHRLSPATVMGYQYGGRLRPAIPRGLYEGSGRPVRLRPGAGAYWDSDAHLQIEKAYGLQSMLREVRGEKWVGTCCPEIETCPRTFACRTPQGIILEAFENLALGMDHLSMFVADARADEPMAFYADKLFPRLKAAAPFLKAYQAANVGTRPCGLSVTNDMPAKLVACRGIPIVGAGGRSLGSLPDIAAIKVRMAGSGDVDRRSPEYQTRVMQIASSTELTNFYARCDRASGGCLPAAFEEAVMAFALPRVWNDGTLATLALVNASIDRQDPVFVRLRGVPAAAKVAVWHRPETEPVQLELVRCGDVVRVRLPRIGGWECGYLDFKGANDDSADAIGTRSK